MLRRISKHGSRRRSAVLNSTVARFAYKENNVNNIYMKPKGNETDAMPLSVLKLPGQVRTSKTGESRESR